MVVEGLIQVSVRQTRSGWWHKQTFSMIQCLS